MRMNICMKSTLLCTTILLASSVLIVSCNRHQIALKKIQTTQHQINAQDSLMASKQKKGTDFEASGTTPTPWTVLINFDESILFRSDDGVNVSSKPAKPVKVEQTEKITSKAGEKPIEIAINNLACDNNPTSTKTTVTYNGKEYSGCGKYLMDSRLHNKWKLDAIDDIAIETAAFPNGMPYFSLDLVKRKVSGFDGCNGFGGNITVMGKRIRFDALMSTLKAYIQNSSYNFKLGLISNNLVDYHFENDNLVLYLIDDSRLQFTPVYK